MGWREEWGELVEERRRALVSRDESYSSIPRLRKKRSALAERLLVAAEARCEREVELLTWSDLERLRAVLREAESEPFDGSRRINYEKACQVLACVAGDDGRRLGASKAEIFTDLARDRHGRVSVRDLYNRIDRGVCAAKTRRALRKYATDNAGWVGEHELERYVYDLIPNMPPMEESFHAFYVFTAARRFMFFLDPKRRGRVEIEALASSSISMEFVEMEKNSWFFPENAKRVYSNYLELDKDHNGMLSKQEFLEFRRSRQTTKLTQAFVDRFFEEIITYRTENPPNSGKFQPEMDFKTYLDVVVAFDNLSSEQSLDFFWRVLDVRKNGRLDSFALNYFFRDIAATLTKDGFDPPALADVLDEIFDMVKPTNPGYLTLEDLKKSGIAHTVILMLVDVAGFLEYDNREHMIHGTEDDDDYF